MPSTSLLDGQGKDLEEEGGLALDDTGEKDVETFQGARMIKEKDFYCLIFI